MSRPGDAPTGTEAEEEVWVAIAAFEQILEAMPNDRASLEALSHAYEQIGDHTRAKDYLMRLGEVVLEEADLDAAQKTRQGLQAYVEEDPKVRDLVDRISEVCVDQSAPAEGQAAGVGDSAQMETDERLRRGVSIADELAFAWSLMEAGELSQEEYAAAVQDLTEMSSAENAGTVSVLHALELKGAKNFERIMRFVARKCGTPIISLLSFDPQTAPLALLPLDYMVRRGVMVFDFIGKDALVAIMNPYDMQLRKDVEALAGRKCHFFTTQPSEFDQTVTRIRQLQQEVP